MPGKLFLVTGGAASGKSEYAEKLAMALYGGLPHVLYYAATMHRDTGDEETKCRIRKHRRQRRGKGFRTIEQERDIGMLKNLLHPGDTVLLEDLSNLLANEMFPPGAGEGGIGPDLVCDRIVKPLLELRDAGVNVVAVGNRITEDIPGKWDEGTGAYLQGFCILLRRLGEMSDRVTEVVCGIPVPASKPGNQDI